MAGRAGDALGLHLQRAGLGVEAHGGLIDGDLVAGFQTVDGIRGAFDLSFDVEEQLFIAKETDPVVAGALRDDGHLGIFVTVRAVDDFIERPVSADRVEPAGCIAESSRCLVDEPDAVAGGFGRVDLIVDAQFFAGGDDEFVHDVDLVVFSGHGVDYEIVFQSCHYAFLHSTPLSYFFSEKSMI